MIHAEDLMASPQRDDVRAWLTEHDIVDRSVYAVEVQTPHLVTVYRFVLPIEHDGRGDAKREQPLVVQARRPFPIAEAA